MPKYSFSPCNNLTDSELAVRLLRIDEVMQMTGFRSRNSIYRLMERGAFPRQRKLVAGGRAAGWVAAEIVEFVRKRAS